MSDAGNPIPFTDNFEDNSTEAGFQFTFFCNKCKEKYKTLLQKSETTTRGSLVETNGDAVNALGRVSGEYNIGRSVHRGIDAISDR